MEQLGRQLVEEYFARTASWARKSDGDAFRAESKTSPPLTLLAGPAGSGKTAALIGRAEGLVEEGTPVECTLYVDCTDPRLPPHLDRRFLSSLVEAFFSLSRASRREPFHLMLDNIEAVDGWIDFARILTDTYPAAIWASGACASWLTPSFQRGLPPGSVVRSLRGRPLDAALRSLIGRYAAAGDADPLRRALEHFYRYGAVAADIDAAILSARFRQVVARGCARIAEQRLPATPLPLIQRSAAHLLAASGTAYSLSELQRALAEEGLATTRATLAAIADALQESQIVYRLRDFGRPPGENARAASMVLARDHSTARAFAIGSWNDTALAADAVFAVLCYRGLEGRVRMLRPSRGRGCFLAWGDEEAQIVEGTVALYRNREGRRPHQAFLEAAESILALTGLHRLTAVTASSRWIAPCDGGTIEFKPLSEWLLEEVGLLD